MTQASSSSRNHVFVRDIASKTDGLTLGKAFVKFGTVTCARVIRSYREPRSPGFGFVVFSTPEAASAAAKNTDPIFVDGQQLTVRPEIW
jgi:polyadenylate-binding protein